ncbi:MAG: protein kinase [Paraglaciecola sp.]|uniref:protein kinase domain-containing protein n=2 Tax=Paraglaciecola sp. TaxID=1920173 RepID=UPI003299BD37
MYQSKLRHFYIPDEQSVYLLSHLDAKKLKDWVTLCINQLQYLGYEDICLIGKGAFGFVFSGMLTEPKTAAKCLPKKQVFKFSRVNLSQHIQDRLEEEAYMLSLINHPLVPKLIEFQRIKKQSILAMELAEGDDLEKVSLKYGPLPVSWIIEIAAQLADILVYLRTFKTRGNNKPIVHGDIKPSNIVFNIQTCGLGLIDWGSSVFAQLDEDRQFLGTNIMDLMSSDMQQTNARLGDVYFIGDEQLNGALSSVRFDEQGVASTLYALASGQSSRFGCKVISANALGLPEELARTLTAMMSEDFTVREKGGDYFITNMRHMGNIVTNDVNRSDYKVLLPFWISPETKVIDTVEYSSRKSFLRGESDKTAESLHHIDDVQFDRYYKNYMQGMGDTEKAFIAAVGRLAKFPVVGGISIHWKNNGVLIDSNLTLFDAGMKLSFQSSLNNLVHLARAIHRVGIFKSCLFNAKDTLHIERSSASKSFIPNDKVDIPFTLSDISWPENQSRMHSYFEDGDDPDEYLELPDVIMTVIKKLNNIHHSGCIIFEALPTHLKIHSDLTLLNHSLAFEFKALLEQMIEFIPKISGVGISGFMKLPFKDSRFFKHQSQLPDKFYPADPKLKS